jgi:NADH:ubiquinone oxidoreductase subunit 5 (subunit L)/multisubunit Na+/H+ antiporter MnhA subunit
VLSVIGGFLGIEALYQKIFEPDLPPPAANFLAELLEPFNTQPLSAVFGLGAVIFGFFAALAFYRSTLADPLPAKLGWLSRAMRNRFYFDELYERILIPATQEALASIAAFIDRWIISGAVQLTQGGTDLFGRALRLVQNGSIQTYAFMLIAGVAVVLYYVLAK